MNPFFRITVVSILALAAFSACVLLSQSALGVDEGRVSSAPEQPNEETTARARDLVERLATGSFSERQKATLDLLELAETAIPELNESLRSGSPELRQRAGVILNQIEKRVFDQRLGALLNRPSVASAENLPAWDRFRDIMGVKQDDSTAVIANYAAILKAEPALFRLLLFRPQQLPAALQQRTSELAVKYNDRLNEPFPIESYAALLLLGSDPTIRLPQATSTNITAALSDSRLAKLVDEGAERETLRALLSVWFVRGDIAADKLLLFAMRHKVRGGRDRARKIIAARSRRPEMILAIVTLGAMGSAEEDLPVIESLLDDTTVLWPIGGRRVFQQRPAQPPRDSNFVVQTRDIALAVACHLRGRNPRQFGMRVRPSEVTLFAVDSMGFESDDVRAGAITAYRSEFKPQP
jgi:hypothetical protein